MYLSGDFYFYFYLTLYFWRFWKTFKNIFIFEFFWVFNFSFWRDFASVKKPGLQLVVREVKGRNTVKGNEKTQASPGSALVNSFPHVVSVRRKGERKTKAKNQIANFSSTCRERQAEEIDREKEHHSIVPLLRLMKSTGGGIFFRFFRRISCLCKQASNQAKM